MKKKARIALITTWFPPKTGVAVNRMLAFAKYLSNDFEVEVFTEGTKNESKRNEYFTVHYLSSHSVLNKLKHQSSDSWLRHQFISAINVAKGMIGYSTLKSWSKDTLHLLNEKHRQNRFDVIISSFSPIETHAIAIHFKKQNPNVLWVADMRDEMSKNPTITTAEKSRLRQMEKTINHYADVITTVSSPILDDFRTLIPNVKTYQEIRNGFDHNINEKNKKNNVFTVGYVGRFYGEISPKTFFEAWLNLKQKHNFNMKVKMIGTIKTFHIPKQLASAIEIQKPVDYLEAIKAMQNMDANLLVHPSGKRKGVYTGKLFDYISVGKPVIGVIDKNDVAAELIEKLNCGYIADFYDVKEIESILFQAYTDWKNDVVKRATDEEIAQLHRKNEVKKLAKLIEQLIAQ